MHKARLLGKNTYVRPCYCRLSGADWANLYVPDFPGCEGFDGRSLLPVPGCGADSFQFLVDDTAPTIGPTGADGFYLFAKNFVGFMVLTPARVFPLPF